MVTKKTFFLVKNLGTDKNMNSDNVGNIIDHSSSEEWLTTDQATLKFQDYHRQQKTWEDFGTDQQFFPVITAVKVVSACPHCGEELDSEMQEVFQ